MKPAIDAGMRVVFAVALSLAIAASLAWCVACAAGQTRHREADAIAFVANAGGARLADIYVATPGAENDPAWQLVWVAWDRFVAAHSAYAAGLEAGEEPDAAVMVAAYCALLAAVPDSARPTIRIAELRCP